MSLSDRLTHMLINSYMKEIRQQLQTALPAQADIIADQIIPLGDSLYTQNEAMAIDAPAVTNLKLTSVVLATYRLLLQAGLDRRTALGTLHRALVEPSRKKMGIFSRLIVRFWPDPLRLMASISRNKARTAYGKAFIMEHTTDEFRSHFITTVTKCLYHDFFKANGAPEITPVFCAFDDNWSAVMQGPESRVQFTRPSTIAAGDEICHFEFRRTKQA
jgi:hypothetical protein